MLPDYYKVLGVDSRATKEQIKAAYNKLVLTWHPDKNPPAKKTECGERFGKISIAYKVLSDPTKKVAYDLARKQVEEAKRAEGKSEAKPGNFEERYPETMDLGDAKKQCKEEAEAIINLINITGTLLGEAFEGNREKEQKKAMEKSLGQSLANAAMAGDWDSVRTLIEQGAPLNEYSSEGWSALYYAVANNEYDLVYQFLVRKVSVDGNRGAYTPLYILVHNSNSSAYDCLPMCEYLITNGASLYYQDTQGDTPLHLAIKIGTPPEIKKLLLANTIAFNTARLHKPHVSKSIDLQNHNGDTPLHLALRYRDWETVRELIRQSADIRIKNKVGNTPLHTAIQDHVPLEIRKLFYNHNDFFNVVNVRNSDGNTPLHLAIQHGHERWRIDGIAPLYESNINITNKAGKRPLDILRESYSKEYIQANCAYLMEDLKPNPSSKCLIM
jgi:ankyrin repeat protein